MERMNDDVWYQILLHNGPLELLHDGTLRRVLAATRVQRAWRRREPSLGRTMRLRFGTRCETGQVVHTCVSQGTRWWTVHLLRNGRSCYVFVRSKGVVGKKEILQ